jgi:hypothetical protein
VRLEPRQHLLAGRDRVVLEHPPLGLPDARSSRGRISVSRSASCTAFGVSARSRIASSTRRPCASVRFTVAISRP